MSADSAKGHVEVFSTFAESDQADRKYYRSLSPEQRLEILLDLVRMGSTAEGDREASEGFARVYRVVERHTS